MAPPSRSSRPARRSVPQTLRGVERRLRNRRRPPDLDYTSGLDPAALVPSRFSTADGPSGLLVPSPVFVLSSVRSGSTLLRMILNSHSQIEAPHELHLSSLEVSAPTLNAGKAVRAMGLDEITLANLLWDRLLHLRLAESGKQVIVDKTPNTTFQWRRVAAFWPKARALILLRHPQRVAESLIKSRPDISLESHYARVTRYARALADAQAGMADAHTIRYEELTAAPERVVHGVCDWLGVGFEPAMINYGDRSHDGQFKRGLGDWSETIRSGVVQPAPADPDPAGVPEALHDACRRLGYPVETTAGG